MLAYFILLLCVYGAAGASWGYKVVNNEEVVLPKDWATINPNCAGQKQSPINIEYELTAFDSTLNPLFHNVTRESHMLQLAITRKINLKKL
jgi:carbonic anhydrase